MTKITLRHTVHAILFGLKMLLHLLLPPYKDLFGKVERFCRKEIERGPFKDFARQYLADHFKDLRRYSDAEREYLALLNSGFATTDIQRGLLQVLYWQGKYLDAIKTFEHLHWGETEDKTIAAFLGYCYVQVNRYSEAVGFLRRAIQLGQDDFHVHAHLAHCLNHMGEYKEAITEYRKALSFRPGSAEVHEGLAITHINAGIMLHKEGNIPEAIEEYKCAVELRPDHFDALFDLAQMCYSIRRFQDALKYARRMIELKPSDPSGYEQAALALLELGDVRGAIDTCEQGLRVRPDDDRLRSLLTTAYRKLG